MGLRAMLFSPVLRWQGRKHEIEEWPSALAAESPGIEARFRASQGGPTKVQQAGHVIGIERWCQSRLRVFLGEPLRMDEYDGYRPGPELQDMSALAEAFAQARTESVALLDEILAAGVDEETRVPHNDFGPLSLRRWVGYLHMHANFESKRL